VFAMLRHSVSLLFLILVMALAAACSPAANSTTPYTKISDASLNVGDAIPMPTADLFITITGKIGVSNNGDSVQMDVPTLERLMQVEYKVNDPFDKVEAHFRGVLLTDLLALLKVDSSATKLKFVALDDYSVEVPIDTIRQWSLMLAVQQDGVYFTVDKRGPAMVVFPNENFTIDSTNDGLWIWQIKSIEVE